MSQQLKFKHASGIGVRRPAFAGSALEVAGGSNAMNSALRERVLATIAR